MSEYVEHRGSSGFSSQGTISDSIHSIDKTREITLFNIDTQRELVSSEGVTKGIIYISIILVVLVFVGIYLKLKK